VTIHTLTRILSRAIRGDSLRGQTLVEYGLLLALISLVVVGALIILGPVVRDLFQDMGNTLTT
jgi:pilus assembly protein Flp/PilA